MVTEDHSRGQVILIGAIALAFIILGVVVVFNGVLYTETVSSGSSSQSASTADVTNTEVNQSIGCLLAALNDDEDFTADTDDLGNEIEPLSDHYQNVTAQSSPSVQTITLDEYERDGEEIVNTTVSIRYDSSDLSYTQELEEIEPDDCPGGHP
ncbi:hypothetical protein G6M89_00685 [Natronolimnobius sp. AArcel1]|uniref:hypothetical protein n=1 Tax=Natronolimnobius sp. AArcel1 TaxID=1679093 RepID=UPI0013EBD6B7|nr:hypothetical protein [Natronolimnobius sp. AArcel1]NGM67535.1 hypothetical protein [Natronolimnobius sp. AArcel1]